MKLRFISCIILIIVAFCSCSKKENQEDYSQMYPPYRLVNVYSKKIASYTNLILRGYGINYCLTKGYEYKNGIGNFAIAYSLSKKKSDEVLVDEARSLLIFVIENLLKEINSDPTVIPDLDFYPFTNQLIKLDIHFEDENRIELGQGISRVFFSKGKIEYEGYNISQYRNRPPAVGKHYTIHEESYEEALEIVKKQGDLKYLDSNSNS